MTTRVVPDRSPRRSGRSLSTTISLRDSLAEAPQSSTLEWSLSWRSSGVAPSKECIRTMRAVSTDSHKGRSTLGFVYVLTNPGFPEVKIGVTGIRNHGKGHRTPEDRAEELSGSSVPYDYEVFFRVVASDARSVEGRAHEILRDRRIPGKEFFSVAPWEAVDAVRRAVDDVAGLPAWARLAYRHKIGARDRAVIALRKNQMFAVLAYPALGSSHAEIVDLWQVHQDGDTLELFGWPSRSGVAGTDLSSDDPVPYLDRAGVARNEAINGKERLSPGDRMVWIDPSVEGALGSIVLEMTDYCQVVARTWRLSAPGSAVRTLNDFDQDVTPNSRAALESALALPRPRDWAPRDAEPWEGWGDVGDCPPEPGDWLPHLQPRT
jgi:hypothetical protein